MVLRHVFVLKNAYHPRVSYFPELTTTPFICLTKLTGGAKLQVDRLYFYFLPSSVNACVEQTSYVPSIDWLL